MEDSLKVALNLLKEINNLGYEAYIIGSATIKYLNNQKIIDIDITTSAKIAELQNFFDVLVVNAKFGAMKINYQDYQFEVTTYRKDFDYQKYRYPKSCEFVTSLKEDVQRRDFTINTIALDANLEVIDYLNGRQDLVNHQLKAVNGEQTLAEDALRMIRLLRFASDYNFKIEKVTEQALIKYKNNITKLNLKQIQKEVKKVKNSKDFNNYLKKYDIIGVIN